MQGIACAAERNASPRKRRCKPSITELHMSYSYSQYYGCWGHIKIEHRILSRDYVKAPSKLAV